MPRRRSIDWSLIFRSMEETGEGPRATARRFNLPEGTVLSAAARRAKEQEAARKADVRVERTGEA